MCACQIEPRGKETHILKVTKLPNHTSFLVLLQLLLEWVIY